MRRRVRATPPRGVTLLEILVAGAVLAVGLATILQIFPMGFAASSKSSSMALAYELAAQKLEAARSGYLFGGIPGTATASDLYYYWGNRNGRAPNPDGATYKEINTDGRYRSFSTTSIPEKNYFYRTDCLPVVDPARKYREFAFENLAVTPSIKQGFATMYRITVSVRGPLRSEDEAQEENWANNVNLRKGAVEVKLATYVANKATGDAVLAAAAPAGQAYLLVKGPGAGNYPYPENFTVFNVGSLSYAERRDTGPTIYANDTGRSSFADVTQTLNRLGMDNVLIFRTAGVANQYVAESNKIVAMYAPGDTGNVSGTYWQFNLLNNLYGRDNDYPRRTTDDGTTNLMDAVQNNWSYLGGGLSGASTTATEAVGYPADTTRVRTLMKLEAP